MVETPVSNVTPPDEVNERLKAVRARYNLTRAQISEITDYAPSTVDAWLFAPDNPNARKMPEHALRLLELELGVIGPRYKHLVAEASSTLDEIRGG